MRIQRLHPNFIMPTKGSEGAGAWDIYMPEGGQIGGEPKMIGLGFATEIPVGKVALLLPRSGVGAKFGLELNNTVGVIDSDYRGEWKAMMRTKREGSWYTWNQGERLFQFMLVPVFDPGYLELVESVEKTDRSVGGFGSTGN